MILVFELLLGYPVFLMKESITDLGGAEDDFIDGFHFDDFPP